MQKITVITIISGGWAEQFDTRLIQHVSEAQEKGLLISREERAHA